MCPIDFNALKRDVEDYKRRMYEYREAKRKEELNNGRNQLYKGTARESSDQR